MYTRDIQIQQDQCVYRKLLNLMIFSNTNRYSFSRKFEKIAANTANLKKPYLKGPLIIACVSSTCDIISRLCFAYQLSICYCEFLRLLLTILSVKRTMYFSFYFSTLFYLCITYCTYIG